MPPKEAQARIKINKLLEEVGWLFLDTGGKKAVHRCRELILFYRGRSPLLKKSYYLKGQWEEYKQSIRNLIFP